MFSIESFLRGLSSGTRINAKWDDEKIELYRCYNYDDSQPEETKIGELLTEELRILESEMVQYSYSSDLMLCSKCDAEVSVRQMNRRIPYRIEKLSLDISDHGYKFSISDASIRYFYALICHMGTHPLMRIRIYVSSSGGEPISSFKQLVDLSDITTVKVTSPYDRDQEDFKQLIHSYLFNITYCNNITFMINDHEMQRRFRSGIRRSGQLFPYRSYTHALTKYYQQATISDIPFTQYLAYYHVAEFFFQSISEHAVFSEIEELITHPSFSPRSEDSIKSFYEKIKKRMRDQRDDGVWNERNGLLLCLKEHVVDLNRLKSSIHSQDASAIEYYKSALVEFASESKCINFDESEELIYSNIRDRVYSIRNAIVHSKEGEKMRYEPFIHDVHLSKEIPLIRGIAEEIIINTSTVIRF